MKAIAHGKAVRLTGIADRFWSKVSKGDGCWLWSGTILNTGYGQFSIDDRGYLSHRISYMLTKGPIPEGLQLDHLCRTPRCVRPDHLEAVTPRVNTLRSEALPAKNAVKTHCHRGHPFDPANTRIKKGVSGPLRICRICTREANVIDKRRLRAREKAGSVVHRHLVGGLSLCGAREFEPGKPRAKMSTKAGPVTCAACKAVTLAHQTKAKLASRAAGLI